MLSVSLFRRLAVVTALFAYLLIALGGLVRVSGSGLGCPDWPLCHGRPYPPADVHAIIEYSHRLAGSVTGVLIIATVILAWLVWRTRRPVIAWLATASLIGVAAEGALGRFVVASDLAPWLVLIHLGLAMMILGFLVATAVMSMPAYAGLADASFKRLAAVSAAATYLMLLTGSTVVASGADAACRTWPLCGTGFTPDFSGASAFTMLHRGAVLLIGLFIGYALSKALKHPGLRRVAMVTLVVFSIQVAGGAVAAVTDGAFFNGLHVALATIVWAGVLAVALLTLPRADRAAQPSHLAVEKRPA